MSELLTPTMPALADHPLRILRAEHELILQLAARLKEEVTLLVQSAEAAGALSRLRESLRQLREAQSHYLREENVLFPFLEKHGIVGPPAVMWSEHDAIRGMEKKLFQFLEASGGAAGRLGLELRQPSELLVEMLETHFYKEDNILFSMATRVLTESEWATVMRGFSEIGFWDVLPVAANQEEEQRSQAAAADGVVSFETGALPVKTLEAILNTMPVDFTFVDDQDRVQYFSNARGRVFPRTTAIIGRQVQQCHPEKSYHLVNQILKDFREGQRDSAEFWIQSEGHFLSIRYFPVRDGEGKYLGCLEVTQDATGLRQLQGEKRLL